ncbi:MAG: hypothetical protein JNK43_00570 [Ignavibacteria bacterium]|nr:hypothetical protein [Ignavibacteria bacterium]
MNKIFLLFLILLAGFGSAHADLLPEGKKKVSYNFRIENINSYPDYSFLVYPENVSNGIPFLHSFFVKDSAWIDIFCKYGTPALYIIRNSDLNKAILDSINLIEDNKTRANALREFFDSNTSLMTRSASINCTSYVERDAKYDVIQDELKIEKASGDSLVIRNSKTIYRDKHGNILEAKDSKSGVRDDVVTPASNYTGYLLVILPVLALILIVSIVLIRKMKKQ